jgi:hypothetical protein
MSSFDGTGKPTSEYYSDDAHSITSGHISDKFKLVSTH